ncbi:uncharacterized protein LOC135848894 [Planococcus citri]|uniref:uncharacterized protein LOC135848894 n=1 Tax=Planococcus citri TaxID=170843 RepID=UPI0031F8F3D3
MTSTGFGCYFGRTRQRVLRNVESDSGDDDCTVDIKQPVSFSLVEMARNDVHLRVKIANTSSVPSSVVPVLEFIQRFVYENDEIQSQRDIATLIIPSPICCSFDPVNVFIFT